MKYKFNDKKHIHLLDGKPLKGTTTIIKEVLPPPLAWYGSGRAVKHLGWYDRNPRRANYLSDEKGMPILEKTFEKIKEMTSDQFLNLLDNAYKAHNEHKKKRGAEGTNTHERVEKALKWAIKDNEGYLLDEYDDEEVEKFAKWGRGKKFIHSEVHVYSEKLWAGGIVDFVFEDDGYWLGDLKTSKGIYSNHIIQEGLYDYQQTENGFFTPEGEKVGEPLEAKGYVVVNIPPKGKLKTREHYDTADMKKFAENICQLHKTLQVLS